MLKLLNHNAMLGQELYSKHACSVHNKKKEQFFKTSS